MYGFSYKKLTYHTTIKGKEMALEVDALKDLFATSVNHERAQTLNEKLVNGLEKEFSSPYGANADLTHS